MDGGCKADDGNALRALRLPELAIEPVGVAVKRTVTSTPAPTVRSIARSLGLSHTDLALLKHLISQSIVWVTGWQLNLDPTAFHPDVHLVAPGAARGGSRAAAAPAPAAAE
jgi:hypothetical protein